MSLKKRTKVSAEFSMSSMTDIIFLLLLFFMITATVVQTNAIKVLLPQSSKKETQKTVVNITIDASLNYFIAQDKAKEMPVSFDEIDGFLKQISNDNPDKFLAIYADVVVPWGEVAKVTEIGYSNNYRLVLMTRPLNKK